MKTLTNEEIITIIEHCGVMTSCSEDSCPLFKECFHYYTGEEWESALEDGESVEEE